MKTNHDLPAPSAESLSRSRQLTHEIQQKIHQHDGILTFAGFMATALYHPELGYYQQPGFALGKHGDFTTAPEISPLFARCFARQCRLIFAALSDDTILELGAGTGRFALDLLTELDTLHALPKHYYIYEISSALRLKQRDLLQSERPDLLARVEWLTTLPENFSGVIIANEVLDAIPFHRFQIINQQPRECMVAAQDDTFIWQNAPPSSPLLQEEIEKLKNEYALADGYQSEIQIEAMIMVKQLCDSLTKGIILLVDYGYGQREFYHPQRINGTMTCFYQHRALNNPLLYPGLQDITAHVDFTRVIETASDTGARLGGFTTQSAFLLANGLLEMAAMEEQTLADTDAFRLHQAIKTLTMPTEMGDRVKVMAISRNNDIPLAGFATLDRRRDL